MLIAFYKSFLGPHLEYCVRCCSLAVRKDGLKLEQMQRQTRLLRVMEYLAFQVKIRMLLLFSSLKCEG